jgi:hypothetical protein
MSMGLLRLLRLRVNVIVSIIPPGVPWPITSPVLSRIWTGCEVTPGIGRVLIVGIGGLSVLVSMQPAVRMRRRIIDTTGTGCRTTMPGFPQYIVGNSMCQGTRKTIGSWI